MTDEEKALQPPQHQAHQPGRQSLMDPEPVTIRDGYRGSGKLEGKVAFISGGDSGIGRAVAVHFAREGADVAVAYLEETEDARETRRLVEAEGRRCELVAGDLGGEQACAAAIDRTIAAFGRLDVLVNNLAEQHPVERAEDLDREQLEKTFRTNLFSFYSLIDAALPHLGHGACIINTGSVTGSRGHKTLLDYAATKGAIHAMTMSFAQSLAGRGIRVNAVAPGPVWTPLIPASFEADKVAEFGSDTLMKRPGQPCEIAPAYVFLACEDASFVTGQILHVNGGSYLSA
ncbi:SDR family oxidoreductase [Arenimonas sp. MALMAid1274]|uniref:SDR family oxidoreductase n=1 Tax=Arenimonas sp. MALMAid1274 TaxID=3411630 RepID=UPI003B9F45A3